MTPPPDTVRGAPQRGALPVLLLLALTSPAAAQTPAAVPSSLALPAAAQTPATTPSSTALAAATPGATPTAAAHSPVPDSLHLERLAALGRLWGVVKYVHPALVSRAAAWDSAAVAAIPRVSAAGSPAEYAAAVGEMLATLGDPSTRVVTSAAPDTAPKAPDRIAASWATESTLVVTVPRFTGDSARELLAAAVPRVRAARWIVFDLRGPTPADDDYGTASYLFGSAGLNALLPARPMAAPPTRSRMYSGSKWT